MPVATIEDLRKRYPEPIPSGDASRVNTMLDDALDEIRLRLPAIDARLAADHGPLERVVVRVQCAMVTRVLSNPNGYLTETIDDYTYRRDSSVSTGKLYLADDEYAALQPDPVRRRGSAFSIRLG